MRPWYYIQRQISEISALSETFTQRTVWRIGAGSPHAKGSVNGATDLLSPYERCPRARCSGCRHSSLAFPATQSESHHFSTLVLNSSAVLRKGELQFVFPHGTNQVIQYNYIIINLQVNTQRSAENVTMKPREMTCDQYDRLMVEIGKTYYILFFKLFLCSL